MTITSIIPGVRYKVKTHNGLGKTVYGTALADSQGRIGFVELKDRRGRITKIAPFWYEIYGQV